MAVVVTGVGAVKAAAEHRQEPLTVRTQAERLRGPCLERAAGAGRDTRTPSRRYGLAVAAA